MALSKRKKTWLIILGIIVVILIALTLFANRILSSKADALLRKQVSKIDTTTYIIDYEKIRVNLFSRSVKIFDISVTPTKAALENVKRNQLAKPVYEVKLQKLSVSAVSILKALKGKEFDVGSIRLDEPDITVYGHNEMFKGKQGNSSGKNIFSSDTIVETEVKEASLGLFTIKDANIRYINLSNDKTILETKALNLTVEDIWLHHPPGDTLSHVLDLEEITLNLGSHSMELPGDFYSLRTGPLDISYKDGELSLDSFQLIPAYSKERFGKVFGKQTDRFDVSADNIKISGIVFDSLLNKKFIAENVLLTSPSADIFRDKRIARDMSIFPKLFQTSLANLALPLFIKTVNVSNGYLNYQEMVEHAEKAGSVVLDKLEVTITGICNYADSIKNGQAMNVEADAMLMGKSPFKVYLYLPIGNRDEYFTYHGSAATFPATNLNQLLEPLVFIKATQGTVTGVSFYAMAMRDTAVGRVEFKYQDLAIEVMKKSKETEQGIEKESKFFSFLARTVIHKSNPMPNKDTRIAKMSFIRDPNKGFFNFIWKNIQNGLIYTITPGKKKLESDMSWPDFKSNWRKTLLSDWESLQVHSEKKRKKK